MTPEQQNLLNRAKHARTGQLYLHDPLDVSFADAFAKQENPLLEITGESSGISRRLVVRITQHGVAALKSISDQTPDQTQ